MGMEISNTAGIHYSAYVDRTRHSIAIGVTMIKYACSLSLTIINKAIETGIDYCSCHVFNRALHIIATILCTYESLYNQRIRVKTVIQNLYVLIIEKMSIVLCYKYCATLYTNDICPPHYEIWVR